MKILMLILPLLILTRVTLPMHNKALLELVEDRIAQKKDLNIGLHFKNQRKKSLLCLAAEKRANLIITLTLLENGANANFKAERCRGEGISPLNAAICDNGDVQTIQALLARGANPNERREVFNYTFLHSLCGKYYMPQCGSQPFQELCAIIDSLLKHGANPNIPDCEGQTPLFWLLDSPRDSQWDYNERVAILRILIEGGANVFVEDKNGEAALQRAKQSGDVWRIQLAKDAEYLYRSQYFRLIMSAHCRRKNPDSLLAQLPLDLIKIIFREICKHVIFY